MKFRFPSNNDKNTIITANVNSFYRLKVQAKTSSKAHHVPMITSFFNLFSPDFDLNIPFTLILIK